jgi:hypothetical protein
MPNIIVELRAESTRVRRILTRLDPSRRVYAANCVRFADENIALNSLEGMKESLADLREINVQPKEPE